MCDSDLNDIKIEKLKKFQPKAIFSIFFAHNTNLCAHSYKNLEKTLAEAHLLKESKNCKDILFLCNILI